MAKGTITGSTGNQYIDAKIEWSSTSNTSTNKSTVTAALYYKRNNTGFATKGTGTFFISIDGIGITSTKPIEITQNSWVKAVEQTVTVSHASDGKKTITISASGDIPGTTLTSTSVFGTAILDTIPRASTITSASDVTLGTACRVKWTPLSSNLHYKLKFSLGEWSDTTVDIYPAQTTAFSYIYMIPLSVANQLPKKKTGTMTVTLYTYSGTTQIGSASSKTFTVTVPENDVTKPTATMTLSPITYLSSPFDALYIEGRTKVDANFTDGEGKYGADIVSYTMKVDGKSYGSPYTSGYLSTSGSVTVEGTVTDSRGFTRKYTEKITVIPYGKPTILPASDDSEIICARCDSEGNLSESGTYLKIKARRNYYKVGSDGSQKNFCAIRYRYRDESSTTFSSWKTILAKSDTSTDTIDSDPISGVLSSAETAYVVQVGVIDDIGESNAVQFIIPTDFVTIDIPDDHKGRRMGLFRYAQETDEDGVYVGLPIFGGSVDSLKRGTQITATAASPIDLNDYRTPGCYYSPGQDYSQHISNTPYQGGGFGLIIREMQSAGYIRQAIYYGRTNWHRHWNGVEWSGWVRTMVTSRGSGVVDDFVIETGTFDTGIGTWHYKKWADGTYQMFGYFDVTPTSSTLNVAVYRTNSISIPSPFKISSACVSGSVMRHCWISNGGITTEHDAVALRLISDEALDTTSPINVRLMVMGNYE